MKQVEHTNSEKYMLESVEHPFIINLWGTFQDTSNLYMVMDFVPGGELFTLLRRSNVRIVSLGLCWSWGRIKHHIFHRGCYQGKEELFVTETKWTRVHSFLQFRSGSCGFSTPIFFRNYSIVV